MTVSEQETERERLGISESEIYVPAGPSLKEKGREMKVFARPAEGDITRGLVVWDGRGPRSGEPVGELSLAVIQLLTHISGIQVALCFTYIGVDAIAKMSTKNRLVILFEDVNYYRSSQERENNTSRFIRQQQRNWASSSVYYRVRDGTGDFGRHFGGFTCRQPTVVQCIFMRFSRLDCSHT